MLIKGSVTDPAKAPLNSALIKCKTAAGDLIFDCRSDHHGQFLYQDGRGQFDGQVLRISAELAGFKVDQREQRLSPRGLIVDFVLSKDAPSGVAITGIVRDKLTRMPIASASVKASVGDRTLFQTPTDERGEFHWTTDDQTLAGRTVAIEVSHALYEPATVRQPLVAAGLDVAIDLEQKERPERPDDEQVTISVTACDAVTRAPLPGAIVNGMLGGANLFTTTTDGRGQGLYTGEAQDLVGQTVLITVTHAGYQLWSLTTTVPDSGVACNAPLAKEMRQPSKEKLRRLYRIGAAALAAVIVAVPIGYYYWYLVSVPQLNGQPLAQATQELAGAGLGVGDVSHVRTGDQRPDTVLFSSPAAGERVPRGTRLNLLIAAALPQTSTVVVPPAKGRAPVKERRELAGAGAGVGDVSRVRTGDQPPDTVLSSPPAAGERVPQGTRLNPVIAAVSPQISTVVVPQLKGHGLDQAKRELAEAGLVVGDVSRVRTGDQRADTVLSSSPAAGKRVPRGTRLNLLIAAASPPLPAAPAFAGYGAFARDQATGKFGLSADKGSQVQADDAAMKDCAERSCRIIFRTPAHQCGAIATAERGTAWGAAYRGERDAAELAAMNDCQKITSGLCKVRAAGCNH